MCGHVGIAGDLKFQDEATFKRLLLFDYFRGPDSTGLAAIRTNGDAAISKLDSNPINLLDMTGFKSALNYSTSDVFMGHNRLATKGSINPVNTHPFQFGDITGCHNGTLTSKTVERLEEALGEEYPVDSMALIAAIDKFGIVKTIGMCTEGNDYQTGAWAIVWYDKKDHTLNFLRNKHRDLYYAYEGVEEGKKEGCTRMFWASEWWMLRSAFDSSISGYAVYTAPKSTQAFFPFEEDVWYKYNLDDLKKESKTPTKPKTRKLAGLPYSADYPPKQQGQREDPFGREPPGFLVFHKPKTTYGYPNGNVGNRNSKDTTTQSPSKSKDKEKKHRVIELDGTAKSPYAGVVTEHDFNAMCPDGCFHCHAPLRYGDPGVTIFERDKIVICRDCSDWPEDMQDPPVKYYMRPSTFDNLVN